jgi:hypothetical protein
MKTIIVKTQSDLDSLPQKFDEYTVIEIRSDPGTWLKVTKARGSSRVVARGSSRVVAWDSSRVVAHWRPTAAVLPKPESWMVGIK